MVGTPRGALVSFGPAVAGDDSNTLIVAPGRADVIALNAAFLFCNLIAWSSLKKYVLPDPVLTMLPLLTSPATIGDVSTLSPSSKLGDP